MKEVEDSAGLRDLSRLLAFQRMDMNAAMGCAKKRRLKAVHNQEMGGRGGGE